MSTINYKNKYLKYKNKYLNLKNNIRGGGNMVKPSIVSSFKIQDNTPPPPIKTIKDYAYLKIDKNNNIFLKKIYLRCGSNICFDLIGKYTAPLKTNDKLYYYKLFNSVNNIIYHLFLMVLYIYQLNQNIYLNHNVNKFFLKIYYYFYQFLNNLNYFKEKINNNLTIIVDKNLQSYITTYLQNNNNNISVMDNVIICNGNTKSTLFNIFKIND